MFLFKTAKGDKCFSIMQILHSPQNDKKFKNYCTESCTDYPSSYTTYSDSVTNSNNSLLVLIRRSILAMESVKDKFKKMLAITNKITSLVKEGCCIFADYLL